MGFYCQNRGIFFINVYQAGSPSDTKHRAITIVSLIFISSRQVSYFQFALLLYMATGQILSLGDWDGRFIF